MILLVEFLNFVDCVDVLGPSDEIGWFACWYCGVLGTTCGKSDELETLICHHTIKCEVLLPTENQMSLGVICSLTWCQRWFQGWNLLTTATVVDVSLKSFL